MRTGNTVETLTAIELGSTPVTYFAVYNTHSLAQTFEGKIRMGVIPGYNDYTPWV